MKLTVLKPTDIDVAAIRCVCPVRYDEEDIPNDFPLRTGDIWNVTVDAETGRIRDWPVGRAESVHMKVCDQGTYYLLDADGNVLATREDAYVPGCLPGEHYGDYIIFDIAGDGTVAGFKKEFTQFDIKESFFPEED